MKTFAYMSSLVVLVLSFLIGCAHEQRDESLQARINSHVGENIDNLVVRFGPPTKVMKLTSGDELYLWRMAGPMITTAQPIPFTRSSQLVSSQDICETQYIVKDGIILSGSYRGCI